MKATKNIAILIAALMGLAFVGIIGIQFYWIVKTVRSEKESFNYQVTGAMLEVVRTLERNELAEETSLFYNEDEIDNHIPSKEELDAYEYSHDQLAESDDKYANKILLTNEFIKHLSNKNKNRLIEERINPNVLDSLIDVNLKKRNITSEYEYAVYHQVRDTLFWKHFQNRETFFKNASSFVLFPSDKMKHPSYLLIYFPDNTQSLLKGLAPLLIATSLIVILLACTYFVALKNIIKQKRLVEEENDFLNNMTHEFKTPISTIALASEMLSDPTISKDQKLIDKYLKTIRDENKRLGEMADKILTTAKISNGKMNFQMEKLDIHEIIVEIAEQFKMKVEIKDGELILDLNATDTDIYGDKVHITNVISNLLDNANKYSPKKPIIKISTESHNNFVVISIIDNGIGIAKSELKKIFYKLYRVPTGDIHNVKGYGLGLSYTKSIVEAHHGHIEVESELGKGSVFSVYLPLYQEKTIGKIIRNNKRLS